MDYVPGYLSDGTRDLLSFSGAFRGTGSPPPSIKQEKFYRPALLLFHFLFLLIFPFSFPLKASRRQLHRHAAILFVVPILCQNRPPTFSPLDSSRAPTPLHGFLSHDPPGEENSPLGFPALLFSWTLLALFLPNFERFVFFVPFVSLVRLP